MEISWQSDSGRRTSRRAENPWFLRNLRTLLTTGLLVGIVASGLADDPLNLSFPDSATRYTWIQDGYPSSLPKDPVSVKAPQIQLAVPSKTSTTRVFVWDKATGTIAEKKLSDIQDNTWDVKPSDFSEVAEVKVSVQHDGKPVATASLDLKDTSRTQSQLLDSTANGAVSFFFVKAGKVETTVKYRSAGAMATPVIQSFDLASKSTEPPVLRVALPDAVETVGQAASAPVNATLPADPSPNTSATSPTPPVGTTTGPAGPAAPAASPVQSSPIGSFFVQLGVLAALLVGGYYAFQYMKKNPEKVKATLEPLGVQIPKSPDDDLNAGIPAVPIQAPAAPQPVQKIMLGDASPDPISAPYQAAPISLGGFGGSAVASSPQLRSASGDTIPISDVPMVVGRDAGLGLSLVGESTVSRRHAEVVKTGDSVVVKDLGSTNGTYVNGAKLQGEVLLRPGDEVQFGAIRFRYEG
jgi:hypothetical protein